MAAAMQDVRAAYYFIHSMAEGEGQFAARDRQAAENFGRAAREMGVERIIYLGGLGSQADVLSPHLRSRQETGELLRQSGVPVTEFRAGVIVGSGSLSFELIRYLTERLPVMICPRWVKTRAQPISVDDVLRYLVECLETLQSVGRTLEIGGVDVLNYRDMMLIYARVRGLKRRLIDVPVLTPRLSSYWVDLVTPIPNQVARPLIEGLKNEVVCRDGTARQLFAFTPLSYEEAIRAALRRTESGEIETIWSGSYSSFPGTGRTSVTLKNTQGMIIERRQKETSVPAASVFHTICTLGGRNGWIYANFLWQVRGIADRLVGGVGMRRGRRSPSELRVGDAVDFWRVEAFEVNRLLRLRAEMKIPGKAWLQFEVIPKSDSGCLVVQSAFFEPKGLAGLFYWYALYPFHHLIFVGMLRALVKRVEGSWLKE